VNAPASAALDDPRVARQRARVFVDEQVVPRAAMFEAEQHIPRSFLAELAPLDMWGAAVRRDYGGAELDMSTIGVMHEEVGRGSSSLRSLLTVHTMVTWAINRWGSTEQQQCWLPALAAGDQLASFCVSEADAGTRTDRITTTAEMTGDSWTITGEKKWITGGAIADVFLVFARTEQGIHGFIVPRSKGVETTAVLDLLGTRAAMVADVTFDGVRVPRSAQLGPPAFAPGFVMSTALDVGRLSVACGSVGIVQGCLDSCVSYATKRLIGDVPLAAHQLTQAKISDMVTAAAAGRALCERAGRLADARDPDAVLAIWVAKYFCSTAAARSASQAVQLHGANGCTANFPVSQHYRDAKIMEIIEGSTELQQIMIAGNYHGSRL
jgi:alkylation response protein AidB-like acyl-CoA dehydrogenase